MTRVRMGTERLLERLTTTYTNLLMYYSSFRGLRLAALTYAPYSHAVTEYLREMRMAM